MAASNPSPKLTRVTTSTASQVQTLNNRLAAIVPTLTTTLSPSTVYQPGIGTTYLLEYGNPTPAFSVANQIGVWTAPEVNGSAPYQVQVETFGGGGGGGGGSASAGGGGGGAGEYACEPSYTVTPGKSYVWIAGGGGTPGSAQGSGYTQPGSPGALTQFDIAGVNLPDGVLANGGAGGDTTAVGTGGAGGTGSANSITANGGAGGTNVSGIASDNALALASDYSLWTPLNNGSVSAWWILDDNTTGTAQLSDATGNGQDATVTSYSGGGLSTGSPPGSITGAPVQVPTATSPAGTWGANPTIAGACVQFKLNAQGRASARIQAPPFSFSGKYLTVSAWTKCDPSGIFGSSSTGAFSTIIANCNYVTTAAGYAIYWRNLGSPANPSWTLNAYVSNGTTSYLATYTLSGVPNPANWLQVVLTYNNGTLSLYVNGALAQATTTTGYTSVPGGAYGATMGVNPGNTACWYFGFLSNVWVSGANALSLAGVEQAYGLTTGAAGGAAGGGSGSPGGAGNNGGPPAGVAGGTGGTAQAVPASLSVRTAGSSGANGSAQHAGNVLTAPSYGGGGGAAGESLSTPPAGGTVAVPFTSAASYCGTDAGAAAGALFNPNQQGTSGSLFSGGASADTASGSKNSLLLIPPGTFSGFQTGASQNKVATQVLLTFRNANPSNSVPSILPIGYSYDTSLPSTYTGADLVQYVGYLAIEPGATWVTIDLTQSYLMQGISGSYGSVPSAIVLGPTTTLTADPWYAYNSPTGNAFYSQVYGPGATDAAGNSLAPYLTIVYSSGTGSIVSDTAPVFLGTFGGEGALKVSLVSNEVTPVSTIQPYATTDSGGNTLAAGYTGPAVAFDPTLTTPGTAAPETWKAVSPPSGMTGTIRYRMMAESNTMVLNVNVTITSTTVANTDYVCGTAINSLYWPDSVQYFPVITSFNIAGGSWVPYLGVATTGIITFYMPEFTLAGHTSTVAGTYHVPLN